MLIIIHRVNKIEQLRKVPKEYGVEIDIRGYGSRLVLTHDPINEKGSYDELEDYLKEFAHRFIIFNMKEAGYEQRVIDLAKKYKIENYFLLDVEFPFLYQATRKQGFKKITVRYSEAEPIEYVEAQLKDGEPLLDWVWIDVNTLLPLNENVIKTLSKFKTCIVCPERWGRPQDIKNYIDQMKKLDFKPDAVMTSEPYVEEWKRF
ncbi:MAG: hypothetical protein AABX07_04660 [Nanoarchaeota archaeon]